VNAAEHSDAITQFPSRHWEVARPS